MASAATLALAIAAWGVILFNRDFSHISFHGVYILDLIYFFWLICVTLTLPWQKKVSVVKSLWPLLLLFVWALVRAVLDAPLAPGDEDLITYPGHKEWIFMARNALPSLYPVLWAAAGFWLFRFRPGGAALVTLGVAIFGSIPHFFGFQLYPFGLPVYGLVTVAAGPLLIPIFLLTCNVLLKRKQQKLSSWIWVSVLGLAAFFPYFHMVFGYMQRTSFAIALILLMILPPLIAWQGPHPIVRTFKIWTFSAVLLALGLGVSGWIKMQQDENENPALRKQVYSSLLHDDDYGENAKVGFEGRTRKILWRSAWEQWMTNPWLGVGFRRMVPKFVNETIVETADGNAKILLPNGYQIQVSQDTVQPALPGFDWSQYQGTVSPPISGAHNSFLTLGARTGFVGLSFLLTAVLFWLLGMVRLVRQGPMDLFQLLVLVIPLSGFLYASANVGLESPQNCLLLWLFYGAGIAASYSGPRKNEA